MSKLLIQKSHKDVTASVTLKSLKNILPFAGLDQED